MTYEQLTELLIVPKLLGQPAYPGGVPVRMENITYNGETLQEKWLKRCRAIVADQLPDKEDEELLCQWVIYYLFAPIWYMNREAFDYGVGPLLKKDLLSMSLSQLIDECLQIGIDPL